MANSMVYLKEGGDDAWWDTRSLCVIPRQRFALCPVLVLFCLHLYMCLFPYHCFFVVCLYRKRDKESPILGNWEANTYIYMLGGSIGIVRGSTLSTRCKTCIETLLRTDPFSEKYKIRVLISSIGPSKYI